MLNIEKVIQGGRSTVHLKDKDLGGTLCLEPASRSDWWKVNKAVSCETCLAVLRYLEQKESVV